LNLTPHDRCRDNDENKKNRGVRVSSDAVVIVEKNGTGLRVRLSGAMRDSLVDVIEPLLDLPKVPVEIDFEKVDTINSLAISDWVSFINRFSMDRPVTFVRCSNAIVSTMNLITSFSAKCKVHSVMRSYICDEGHRTELEIKILANKIPLSDDTKCQSCPRKARAELNSEDFFQFAVTL